jgi:hypothetical protein
MERLTVGYMGGPRSSIDGNLGLRLVFAFRASIHQKFTVVDLCSYAMAMLELDS